MSENKEIASKIYEEIKDIDLKNCASTAVKAVMSEMPIPGISALLTVWNEHEAIEQKRKLELFIKAFVFLANQNAKRFESIEQNVQSVNERMNEFGRVLKLVKEEVYDRKVELLSTFAVNMLISSEGHDTKISLLQTFNELTVTDLNILQLFADGKTYLLEDLQQRSEIPFEKLIQPIVKLESRGLISQTSGKGSIHVVPHHNADWKELLESKYFEILPCGVDLIIMLKDSSCKN